MAAKKTGLGSGLDTMIPSMPGRERGARRNINKLKSNENNEAVEPSEAEGSTAGQSISDSHDKSTNVKAYESVIFLKTGELEPNRDQPRKKFDDDALLELSESIKQHGILQPVIVKKNKDYYEIIAGERRWRAAQMAGLKEVPVIVRDYSDIEQVEISLIENIQREDLNPIEEALAYKRLLEEFSLKQDEVADKVSKSRTAITNALRLLRLDERVQQMVIDEMISSGHARALIPIADKELQWKLAMQIFDEKLSVREVEKLIKKLQSRPVKTSTSHKENYDYIYRDMEEKMKTCLGTKVKVNPGKNNKGKIEIEYYSQEELERIYDIIKTAAEEHTF